MTEINKVNKTKDRLQKSILLSIEHFRNCEDQLGLVMFLNFIDDLEIILDINKYLEQPKKNFDKLLPALQALFTYMLNQDIEAMTDILEYTIYPLLGEEY